VKLNDIKLITESRGTPIDEDKLKHLLETKYSSAFEAYRRGDIIYRGVRQRMRHTADFMEYSPKEHKRQNKNTSPFINEIMSTDPKWKGFQREQSLICTVDKSYASGYGQMFIVLPENGAIVGTVDGDDFWHGFTDADLGFPRINGTYGLGYLYHLVSHVSDEIVRDLRKHASSAIYDGHNSDLTEMILMINNLALDHEHGLTLHKLRRMDKYITRMKKFEFEFDVDGYDFSDLGTLITKTGMKNIIEHGFEALFRKILDPSLSGKLHKTTIEQFHKTPKMGEVWTAADSLLIADDAHEVISDIT